MRATVDDRALAGLMGADPVRANRVAWILGTQMAAVGGILIAPELTLDATQLSLLIVSAYTAAVFGRLRSLPLTFVGAIVVGAMESYLTGYLPPNNAFLTGLRLAAPALLLFAALLVFPHGRLRGRDRRLRPVPVPTMRGTAVFAAAIVAFGVVLASVLSKADLISYGAIFSLGIVALSYVPLAGYAGQISLCQLSMAGIGAVVWAHLGANGQWWALVVAVAVAAVAGALIAVPALRLSGIYLALGTAAFAVVCDQWIFNLPSFQLFGIRIALFNQGSASAVGPRLFGFQLGSESDLMVLAAVCLGLLSLGVAALRRGRFGRRLIALHDSEAAYATLGGSLLLARVAVFALAAAIAGLGGALYAMQQQSVTASQFSLVAGLPIFLIAVVGGLASVGDGLFTGITVGGSLAALVEVAPWAGNLAAILPALAGIGLGSNPDGVVPRLRRDWEPAGRNRIAVAALVGGLALAWVLRLAHVINGWAFFGAALLVVLAVRGYAARQVARQPELPVEWWGLRRDWRPEDEEVLARGIAGG
jgi:branched-chain amino acid transport system permease protein